MVLNKRRWYGVIISNDSVYNLPDVLDRLRISITNSRFHTTDKTYFEAELSEEDAVVMKLTFSNDVSMWFRDIVIKDDDEW